MAPVPSYPRSREPRVTVGIATYNRDTYLAEAIESVLAQEGFDRFELVVVEDGTTNPRVGEVVRSFADSRVRVVRHPSNEGIAAAYNTIVGEARGELIALLGDDDRCLPDRLGRQVAIFNRHPQTGVVHGDASIIDGEGREIGSWPSAELYPGQLLRTLVRRHNYLIDPTRMVHRRVYETVGRYDPSYRISQDFHFWLRAARRFRFRHTPGGPVICLRRHGDNLSDERNQEQERLEVERALEELIAAVQLRELVPELDWELLDPAAARRAALLELAGALERRALPLPGLARKLREQARAIPVPARRSARKGPLLLTSYGFSDSGGGTLVPRLVAKELVRRGYEVSVFYAAAAPADPSGPPYELREAEQDGVRLFGVFNRPHALLDPRNPRRELDDPPITAHFAALLDRLKPRAVHFHNLHNLGGELVGQTAARGIPSFLSLHNHWLLCPRGYLLDGGGNLCPGPADGSRCATCVGVSASADYRLRFKALRALVSANVNRVLAPSESVLRTFIAAGYPPERLALLPQALPHLERLWLTLGARPPTRARGGPLRVGFLGSVLPHKGPQLLVEAAQLVEAPLRVELHGETVPSFADHLLALDGKGVVDLCGPYTPTELQRVLGGLDLVVLPSMVLEVAPLAAAEARAARLPLVVPRLGGLAEAVRDGVDGLRFTPFDPASLASCLERLAGEEGLLERLSAAIPRPPSFERFVDQLEAYYAGEQRPLPALPRGRTAIRLVGDHGLNTSLSLINGRLAGGLDGKVQRVDGAGRELDPPLARPADLELRHRWPPALEPAPSGRLAVILPWEFGAVPRQWLAQIRENVDLLLVPSDYVRGMFERAGVPAERLAVVPNGVDLDLFQPDGSRFELELGDGVTRFLFVGGLIMRKGADLLLEAFKQAFADRDDVALVVKGSAAQGIYYEDSRQRYLDHLAAGNRPPVVLIERELAAGELAALYRSCDVLVHPYRGEGFALPVLEGMASGLAVVVTAGGPTDEYVPDAACWRVGAKRVELAREAVGSLPTQGRPWLLEPDREGLVAALRAALDRDGRARKGEAARAAAKRLSWSAVLAAYNARLAELLSRPRAHDLPPTPQRFDRRLRLLATPAWLGEDRLDQLLREWATATVPDQEAVLLLLADPQRDPDPERLEQRLRASGVDFDRCADITVVSEPGRPEREQTLLRSVDLYLPLHAACEGWAALAREAGVAVVEVGEGRVEAELARRRLQFDVAGRFAL